MQATIEMTTGLEKLKEILASFPEGSEHWNEAQNRFQFIDRLLVECLGWEHPFMEVERTDEAGGRADYVLGKPIKAVLEAKREARRFDLLPTGKPGSVRKLRPLLAACKVFAEAVHQVIGYCSLTGAQTAIVCNGPQLAIFQAISIGQSPLDGECYIFNGFSEYISNFPLLWSFLSPEGVNENRAYRQLALHRNPRIPAKASTAIIEPFKYRYRSPFQENLRSLASILLEDIETHPAVRREFYRECYVPMEANNRHLLLSKNIISSRYRRATESGVSPSALDMPIVNGKVLIGDSILAEAVGSRPIVVLGDVGVGKTSFFENLIEQVDEKYREDTYFIHINLGVSATMTDDIKSYVLDRIASTLRETYEIDIYDADFVEAVYHSSIDNFDKTVEGKLKSIDIVAYEKAKIDFIRSKIEKKDVHIQAALGHLAHGREKQIIVIIDNADQRTFDTQQHAFLIAQELAATRNMLVFVALRPSTFYLSKMTGALSGYQNKVLTISPPPADEVLRKRIAFAVNIAEGRIAPAALTNIRLNLSNIVSFLKATLRAIRGNEKIRSFLSNIAGGNTRLVVELITSFCGSPNVESARIVEIEQETNSYQIPLHEFTKHALLGEYAYYNPQSSFVALNLFDISTADPREHFLAPLIISYLASASGQKDNDGFVAGYAVIEEMKSAGFIEDQVRSALRRLASKRLLETPHGHYREIKVEEHELPDQYHFRATSIGIYHTRFWMGSFAFLDAMCTDTPIFDLSTREVVFKLASSMDIKDRLKRTEAFRAYLEAQWTASNFSKPYLDLHGVLASQDDTFASVRRAVAGKTGRGKGRRTGRWAS